MMLLLKKKEYGYVTFQEWLELKFANKKVRITKDLISIKCFDVSPNNFIL